MKPQTMGDIIVACESTEWAVIKLYSQKGALRRTCRLPVTALHNAGLTPPPVGRSELIRPAYSEWDVVFNLVKFRHNQGGR